jgi:hypothetical protein
VSADPNNVADRLLAGFMSSLFLAPVQKVFPRLFRHINTFRSFTLTRIETMRKAAQARKKELKCSASGPGLHAVRPSLWKQIRTYSGRKAQIKVALCSGLLPRLISTHGLVFHCVRLSAVASLLVAQATSSSASACEQGTTVRSTIRQ